MRAATLPRRKPCGRRAQLPRAEDKLVALTAAQPHRRGERTTAGATPWQRALKSGAVADRSGQFTPGELEIAMLAFCNALQNYRKAWALPVPYGTPGAGFGNDIPPRLRARWLFEWAEIRALLQRLGKMPAKAVFRAADSHPDDDERVWASETLIGLSEALRALAGHFAVRN